jgi:DNA polymerase-3 subunit delta'
MPRPPRAPDADPLPEPDRAEGAPHPRETLQLFGHAAAEAAFLAALAAGRAHHAWLLTGPRGIGKATFAWRIARFLLTRAPAEDGLFGAPPPPASLDSPADHPVAHRLRALSEPRLHLIRRGPNDEGKALSAQIRVDDIRPLRQFLGLRATDGGDRVVILDAADEMNPSAANAILKLLEEPPAGVTFLIVSHQPARLLPTIRSRCRTLALRPLPPAPLAEALALLGETPDDPAALAELAGGSVGAALALTRAGGLALYAETAALFATLPRLDRARMNAWAEPAGQRGAEARFDLTLAMVETLFARAMRQAAGHPPGSPAAPGEAAALARIAPDLAAARTLAALVPEALAAARAGKAVNLDPATLLVDTALRIDEAAAALRPPGAG